ncbi:MULTISPECIES: thiamine-binding protein [unclassified Gemella]|uniref:thiamine-binding protein n=1 Tax=unclassified Gemella TaxID=2624949 RepID=UPI001C0490F4|nr:MULTISPECIES: thiamine-binding protein [unclassified Gemella]MBU0278393.1 thiamine-binding protein [Gemella sp. zg-1178]QWQ38989.1 thiamine-binding protein [Gemella sp. zg-570]
MLNCSIALQILPLGREDRIEIIDKVIYFLKSRHDKIVVSPFETVIEGEFNYLMDSLKMAIDLAGKEHKNIFANVKINYGEIMTSYEKIKKFDK